MGGGSSHSVDLLNGEEILEQQPVRYRDKLLSARGQLFLTNKRLMFRPVKNWIGPSVAPTSLDLERITAIGRHSGGGIVRLFLLGQNTDSWFVEACDRRYWFDLGLGWNKMWLRSLQVA
jgi:hypothetical protein